MNPTMGRQIERLRRQGLSKQIGEALDSIREQQAFIAQGDEVLKMFPMTLAPSQVKELVDLTRRGNAVTTSLLTRVFNTLTEVQNHLADDVPAGVTPGTGGQSSEGQ